MDTVSASSTRQRSRSLTEHWPLHGLRLRTPRLELRLPDLDDLAALADRAAEGVHEPDRMPFTVPWTDAPPAEVARGTLQYHWGTWSSWRPEDWRLELVTVFDGEVVGSQAIAARDFATLREVSSGSWLGLRFQGAGVGTEMRAAVLHLAFAGLGAVSATSGALEHNQSSRRVSGKLGYAEDGITRCAVRGAPVTMVRYRIDRAGWQAHRRVPVEIEGLERCLPLFGVRD